MTMTVMHLRRPEFLNVEPITPSLVIAEKIERLCEEFKGVAHLYKDSCAKFVLADEQSPSGFGIARCAADHQEYYHLPHGFSPYTFRFGWGHVK